MRKPWLVVLAVVVALLAALPGPARASAPPASGDATAVAAQVSCASLKKKAMRYRRGSANRRRYIRRYKRCRSRANRERTETPSVPEATPAPVAAPAPPAPTPATLAGPIYLPSIFPNPNGYVSGAGCQPGYEQTYILAGYSCQYAGYNSYLLLPGGPVWTPVYLLFGIWYCADGGFRFRC
jgi:hypothetical protein